MKISTCAWCGVMALGLWLTLPATGLYGSDHKKVYSKRPDLPLLASPLPSAEKVAKAKYNEGLEVMEEKGRWLKVGAAGGEGWVYSGNVSLVEIDENHAGMSGAASPMTAAAASRGLNEGAEKYANEHDLGKVVEQLKWAEDLNAKIGSDEVSSYLKEHKLGEYSEAK